MNRLNLSVATLLLALLSACGGDVANTAASDQPKQAGLVVFDKVAGYWTPKNGANEAFEFYEAPTEFPYDAVKTGRLYKAGQELSRFHWDVQANGTIKISTVAASCSERPLNRCRSTGSVTVAAYGGVNKGSWVAEFDTNADGVVDKSTRDVYARKELDLGAMAQGEFFLNRSDVFDLTTPARIDGSKITIGLSDFGQPMYLSGPIVQGKKASLELAAGEASAMIVARTFNVGGTAYQVPVKVWYERVELSAGAKGLLVEYELRRKVQLPPGVDGAAIDGLAAYERPQKATEVFGIIDKFMTAPVIQAKDKFYSFVLLNFNPDWVSGGGGNLIDFSSATAGSISHRDLLGDKYSEARFFNWYQRADGTLVYDFGFGIEVTARFIKPVNGGYQVLYTLPDPVIGARYIVHDMVKDAPVALTEATIPGRYAFTSSDGLSDVEITLHKDKTVTGVVGGYWFLDTNGDVVSYECTDLAGKVLSRYEDCYASFSNLPNASFAHIRRLRFMHQDGNNFQVKYDASIYGARYQIVDRDYFTISWTYRWRRVGDA